MPVSFKPWSGSGYGAAVFFFGLLGGFGSWEGRGHAEIVERIVAVVGKDIILLSEVNEHLQPMWQKIMSIKDPAARQRALARARRQVLIQLVQERLILQEAQRRKIHVTSEELNRAIQRVLRNNHMTYSELVQALAAEGQTMTQYRRALSRQLLRLKVINLVVRSRVTVSKADVRAYYEAQKRKLGVGLKLHLAVIRLSYGRSRVATIREAQRLAGILARDPDKFSEFAAKYSREPSARKDGDIGFVARGVLPPEVDDVVFGRKVPKGTIVGPVAADDAVYLVRVLGRKESQALPFEQVKDKIRQQLLMQRLEEQTTRWLEELRKKTYIDIRL